MADITPTRHIAIFVPSLRGGGAELVMVTLANAFVERGYSVDLILSSAEGPYLIEVAEGVRVVDLDCSRVFASLLGLTRYLRREHPAVLLSAMGHANAVAVLARAMARVPTRVIVSERAHLSTSLARSRSPKARLLVLFIRGLYRRADGIIAVSGGVAEDLADRARIPRDRIDVVFNPVVTERLRELATEFFNPHWLPDDPRPLVLAAGRLAEQKGFSVLLRAFAKVRAHMPVRLVIMGEGELRGKLEREIERLDLSADVVLPGFVDNPFAIMRRADLFVLSSSWEGLPNALIQAMACGTPVVSTDCPSGPSEILEDGRWGRLVPVGDEAALAQAMVATLNEKDHERPDVAKRANDFDVARAVDRYLAVMLPDGKLEDGRHGA